MVYKCVLVYSCFSKNHSIRSWLTTCLSRWGCYTLEHTKWDAYNRKCLMVIKSSIIEAIRGAIPNCETAKEYLKKVDSQITGSSKMHASTIIKRLVTEK
jgi:hypothetical protein